MKAVISSTDVYANRKQFNNALAITQQRNYRGDTTRILRRKSICIERNPASTPELKEQAKLYKHEAAQAKAELIGLYGLDDAMANVLPSNYQSKEDSLYDQLVCLYFR